MVIDAEPFHERFQDMYFSKVLKENQEYLEKHGVGPYEYKGKFANRVMPYLDAGYWNGYDKWMKKEFNISNASGLNEFHFETEEEAAWFILRYS